jgi:methionyl-tRNA formyltransferase
VIWRASILEDELLRGTAGEIMKARGDELIVSCGDETQLRLHEVQPEGKRRLSVRDFLNGARVRAGDRIGT